jgi:transposase
LKFGDALRVVAGMTLEAMREKIELLERQLRDRDARIATLQTTIAGREALLADRDAQIARLSADVAELKKIAEALLAQRSPGLRVTKGQGLLFADGEQAPEPQTEHDVEANADDGEDGDDDPTPPQQPRRKGTRRAPGKLDTTGLPRTREVHDLPEAQRIDPVSGKPLVCIGERITEELDYQRGRILVIERVQKLYGLPPEEAEHRKVEPKAATLPPKPFDNCIASAILLAWILVQKFCNHLPLYRQQRIFEREGLRLSRKTQCDWALASAGLLEPIAECLMRRIRAGPIALTDSKQRVLQLDDTPVRGQGGRGESNFQARLWAFFNPEVRGVAYRFTPGRDSASLADLLGDFDGFLGGDGYPGNHAAAKKVVARKVPDVRIRQSIRVFGCWAHVLRKFRDAAKEGAATSTLFCDLIRKLYEVERDADAAGLLPEARTQMRQHRSRPIVLEIFQHAWRLGDKFNDAGLLAKAIGYVRGQHRTLRTFLENGRVPIDNNACERAIRPIAIGRKNWLFAGSMRGGRAAATAFTLIESCRIAGIDPVDYLADVLVRVGSHPASRIEELLPDNWAKLFAKTATEAVSA